METDKVRQARGRGGGGQLCIYCAHATSCPGQRCVPGRKRGPNLFLTAVRKSQY